MDSCVMGYAARFIKLRCGAHMEWFRLRDENHEFGLCYTCVAMDTCFHR